MRAYCGQTREADLSARLAEAGVGECTVRGELRMRRRDPWFYDNGAYRDWKAGKDFNGLRFERDMRRIRYSNGADGAPDFVVVPDLVARGEESLEFTNYWRWNVGELPAHLAVQDGMTIPRVHRFIADSEMPYAGIFVGGSLEWKLATSAAWVELAHAMGLHCHVGRVGTPDRVRWAHEIGADSIDSCLPLMYEKHLIAFLAALDECGGSN